MSLGPEEGPAKARRLDRGRQSMKKNMEEVLRGK